MWTLRKALRFIRKIQPELMKRGWYCSLAGGVLNKGESKHDLDLVMVPMCSLIQEIECVRAVMRENGFELMADHEKIHRHWAKKGSYDRKHVEAWWDWDKDLRIDVIIPSKVYENVSS